MEGIKADFAVRLKAISVFVALIASLGVSSSANAGPPDRLTVDLLTDANVRIDGAAYRDMAGYSVSDAGDVNGDGRSDAIVGAPYADSNGREGSGSAYVVFGPDSPATVDLDELGEDGFRIDGASAGDRLSISVSGAGDVNGDGLDDVIVGADSIDDGRGGRVGSAYVVFGKESTEPVDLSQLDERGFQIGDTASCSSSGFCYMMNVHISVSGAGDVNGDGLDDVIVGARLTDNHNAPQAGSSYVVFGKRTIETVDLSRLGSGGFSIDGVHNQDFSGASVSGAGDVNGDGLDDVIVGAPYADYNGYLSGSAYVVLGSSSTDSVNLASLGGRGFRIDGAAGQDRAGISVSGAGDVNDDGLNDVVVGADFADNNDRLNSGSAYIIYGRNSTVTVDLADLGGDGFRIDGGDRGDEAGTSVAGAGDVNDDGRDDVIVSAPYADNNDRLNSGSAYVVYSPESPTTVDLDELGEEGLRIDGSAGCDSEVICIGASFAGRSVSGAGDVNGDGLDDVIVGAPGVGNNWREESGSTYIVYGCGSLETAYRPDFMVADSGEEIETREPAVSGADIGDLSFTVAPSLPEGMSLDPETGEITGTPGTPQAATSYTITVTHYNGCKATADFIIRVKGPARGPGEPFDLLSHADIEIGGVGAGDEAGYSVSGAGDVNGDGRSDTVVGAPGARGRAGSAYVIFGPESRMSVDLNDLGEDGFSIDGVTAGDISGDKTGYSVSGAGDVNGDGLDDVIVGAPGVIRDGHFFSGSAYVVFGKRSNGPVDLAVLGEGGFSIEGAAEAGSCGAPGVCVGDYAGASVSGAGDVNGDRIDDVIVGAPQADNNGRGNSGSAYVVFGGSTETVDLNELGERGFRIDGAAGCGNPPFCHGDYAGTSVSGAGDVNGDGRTDLIVGAPEADNDGSGSGSAYVVYGKRSNGPVDLAGLGEGGFRIDGASSGDRAGTSVSDAGDVNNNGRNDVIVGAPYTDNNWRGNSGSAYVVYGKSSNSTVELAGLGEKGIRIDGASSGDRAGTSVSGAGDVNSDGAPDVIVGAPLADKNGRQSSGSAYVVYGRSSNSTVDLAGLGKGGLSMNGAASGDRAGDSVAGAGDANGDRYADTIVGVPYANNERGRSSGSAYVIYGAAGGPPVDPIVIPGPPGREPGRVREVQAVPGRKGSCERVPYESRLEIPREIRLRDLLKGRGVKVIASADHRSVATVKIKVGRRAARYFYRKKGYKPSRAVAQKRVKIANKPKVVHLAARGQARKAIRRALGNKRAPKRMRLKASIVTRAVSDKRLKISNARTFVALRRGRVRRGGTHVKVRRVFDRSQCGEPFK